MLGVCAMRNYLWMLLCVLCCVSGPWVALGVAPAALGDGTRALSAATRAPSAFVSSTLAIPTASATGAPASATGAASAFFTSNPLVVPGGLEESEQLRVARAVRMSSPEAIVAREVSRTAFAHLSAAGAAKLAREAFPAVVDQPAGGPPPLQSGEQLVRYVSENAAQLALPNGRHAVIESLDPIAKQTSRGHFTPLNLSLSETGGTNGAFAPKTALATVSIPKRLAAGVALADIGVTVTPVNASGSSLSGAQGTRDGASVLYANTQTATDTLVKPTPTGFELDALLRAADSPANLYFKIAMPAGAHLSQNPSSSEVSVIRDGKPIALVIPPTAHDAEGTFVPVSMTAAGNLLTLHVARDSEELAYPLEVDPTFEGKDTELTGYSHRSNWFFCVFEKVSLGCVRESSEKGSFGSHGWNENGPLVANTGADNQTYLNGYYAVFIYTTEGETHIYKAGLHTEEQNNINEGENAECNIESYMQIASGTKGSTEIKEFKNEARHTLSVSENGSWPEEKPLEATESGKGNSVFYSAQAYGTGDHFTNVLWSDTIYIEQPETVKPEIALNTTEERLKSGEYTNVLDGTNKWLGPASGAIGFNVKEKGLGVSKVWAEAETVGSKKPVQIYEQNLLSEGKCSGIQCPEETTPAPVFTYNEKDPPPNGVDTLIVHAESAAKNQSEAVATINVDNEPPIKSSIKLFGLPSNGQIDEQPYKLRAEATDGSGSTKSSGIAALELDMDGHKVLGETKYGSCTPGPCATSSEWTISGEHFALGTHKLKVVATDYAGNKSEGTEYTVTVRHASALPAGPGSVNPISGALHLEGSDVLVGDGNGALSVSRSYDSRELSEGEQGPLGPQWQLSVGGDQQVQPEPTGAVTLIGSGGNRLTFESNGSGGFISPPADEGLVLEKEGSTYYLLKNPALGTTVKYKQLFSGGPWVKESSEGALSVGNGEKETYEWESVEGATRPKLVVASSPAGVNCASKAKETKGCRALEFSYATNTTATGETPSEWKEYKGRLTRIYFDAYNPSTKAMERKVVAEYTYDKQGRLRAEWDPQISSTLKTTYGYDAEGHVTSVNPPGQEPSILHYGTTTSDPGAGRLLSATRPPAGTATSVKEQDEKAAPENEKTAPPTLSTTSPVIGTALSVSSEGKWSNSPLAYSYQWEDCNGKGAECVPIPGAVNQSYTPVLGDGGHELVAQVTATNADAAVLAPSAATSVVALPAPTHSTSFGKSGSGAGEFKEPGGVALAPGGEVWVTDPVNSRVEEFSSSGSFIQAIGWEVNEKGKAEWESCTSKCQAGKSGSGNGEFANPEGIAINQTTGDVYVVDGSGATSFVQELSPSGEFIASFGGPGSGKGQLDDPHGAAIDANGNVWVADSDNNRIEEFSSSGTFVAAFGWGVVNGESKEEQCTIDSSCQAGTAGANNGEFHDPLGVAIANGDVYVTDSLNKRVEELSASGSYLAKFGESKLSDPWGISTGQLNDDLYVTDTGNSHVDEFNTEGGFLGEFGSVGSEEKEFNSPVGISISASTGQMYIADEYNNRVDVWLSNAPLEEPIQSPPAKTTSAVTTIDYNVPLEGNSELHKMTKAEVEKWGQKDLPTEATAIFPPDKPMGWPAKEYKRATVWYFDEHGHAVNVANSAGGVSTSEYNEDNEVIRSLSADNREAALKESTQKTQEEASERLDTKSRYNGETEAENKEEETAEKEGKSKKEPGARLLETTGPEHEIKLVVGGEREARNNVRYYYNEGAPKGNTVLDSTYDLGTKTIDSALYEGSDHEERKTVSSYSGQEGIGWLLRKPTSVTTGPNGLSLTTTTIYDPATGKVLETRSPAGSSSTSPPYLSKFVVSGLEKASKPGLAMDANDNLWVANENKIEEYSAAGTKLLSVGKAGSGNGEFKEPHGIAVGPANTIWVADSGNNRVQELNEKGEWQKTVGEAGEGKGQFKDPSGIAFGPRGMLWVSDSGNNRIEKFSSEGHFEDAIGFGVLNGESKYQECLSTCKAGLSGSGEGQFSEPTGVAVDGVGDVWVTDTGNNRLEELTSANHYLQQLGELGEGKGQFRKPDYVAVDANGNLWVSDYEPSHGVENIQEFSPSGAFVSEVNSHGSGNGQILSPDGVTLDSKGDMWIADQKNNRLEEFSAPSSYLTKEYHQAVESEGEASLAHPVAIAVGQGGNRWVLNSPAESNAKGILKEYAPSGAFITSYSAAKFEGGEATGLKEPYGLAPGLNPGSFWIADRGNKRLVEAEMSGTKVTLRREIRGAEGNSGKYFTEPVGVATDSNGHLWALLEGGKEVAEFTESSITYVGKTSGSGCGVSKAKGIAVNAQGNVLVADTGDNRVVEFNSKGECLKTFGTEGTGNGQLKGPEGIVGTDAAGDVWVADTGNDRVEEFNAKGEYIAQFGAKGNGSGQFEAPTAVATGSEGDLWVTDGKNDTLQKFGVASSAKGAHDTETVYYTAAANSAHTACGEHPEWAELPCLSQPAVQPGTAELPNLPVVKDESYNIWDEPETVKETFEKTTKYAEATRTKKITYDAAGRVTRNEEASSSDTSLPAVSNTYNSETGALIEQSTTVGETTKKVTSVFNTLGQMIEYADADGNKSTYTYDEDGRPKTVNDGKGTQTYTYSTTNGLLTELADSAAKTFTASYDVEGKLTSETYPNAMKAKYTYNSAGEKAAIEYEKTAHCAGTCPEVWFKETIAPSIHGEALLRTSSLAKEEDAYDEAGRLTRVNETPVGKGCKSRLYEYNEDSDRTGQTTRESSTETCESSGGTTVSHSYDTADRLTDSGVEYEVFGNQTKVPAADAEGQAITATFYVDNQTHTETQNGKKLTDNMDPAGRVRETLSEEGSTKSTTVNHYAGSGETISWASEEEGSTKTWTRNIPGIDGTLTAVEKSGEETAPVLLLHDLQGDVVAEAKLSETETKLKSTYNSTEFGVPVNGAPPKFSWLGALGVDDTELPSGENATGGVSYVSQLGAVLQTQTVMPAGAAPNGTYIDPYISKMTPGAFAVLAGAAAESEQISEKRYKEEHPPPAPPPGVTPGSGGGGEGDEEEGESIIGHLSFEHGGGGAHAAGHIECAVGENNGLPHFSSHSPGYVNWTILFVCSGPVFDVRVRLALFWEGEEASDTGYVEVGTTAYWKESVQAACIPGWYTGWVYVDIVPPPGYVGDTVVEKWSKASRYINCKR
jgi:YD repeat-containing protein